MARTVVAIYDSFQTANQAVRDLVDNGFPRDNISIIANNARGEYTYTGRAASASASTAPETESVADETGAGAGVGAGIGAAIGGIGGLLVGLGALTIPGIGPVIAAGPLAVALSTLTGAGVGAVAGGVTGGLLGALIGLGIPEEEAGYYAEGVRRGGVLVTVQAEDQNTDQILGILNHHNPMDIHERVKQWRTEGWKGFDTSAQPLTPEQTNTQAQGVMRRTNDSADFDPENPLYRSHYNDTLVGTGYPYDYYVPAYRYGYGLASDARYQNSTWDVIQPNARRDWEREHPGTWDRFENAIRHAWENVTGQGSNPNSPNQF